MIKAIVVGIMCACIPGLGLILWAMIKQSARVSENERLAEYNREKETDRLNRLYHGSVHTQGPTSISEQRKMFDEYNTLERERLLQEIQDARTPKK